MTVSFNGEPCPVEPGTSVAELLGRLGVPSEAVVVERNGKILEKARYKSVFLEPSDRLEVVRFVGGG